MLRRLFSLFSLCLLPCLAQVVIIDGRWPRPIPMPLPHPIPIRSPHPLLRIVSLRLCSGSSGKSEARFSRPSGTGLVLHAAPSTEVLG